MANQDSPSGLKPVKHLNGNPWNGVANMYSIPVGNAAAIFIGDAVVSEGSADATGKYPSIAGYVSGGGNLRGVVIGFSDQPFMAFDTSDLDRKYCPATTAMYALVVDDPDVIFEIQEDNDSGGLAATEVGGNADIAVTAGNTASGISGMELDSSGVSTTAEAQLRIMGVVNREDNELGDYCKWLVKINEHELRSTTGV